MYLKGGLVEIKVNKSVQLTFICNLLVRALCCVTNSQCQGHQNEPTGAHALKGLISHGPCVLPNPLTLAPRSCSWIPYSLYIDFSVSWIQSGLPRGRESKLLQGSTRLPTPSVQPRAPKSLLGTDRCSSWQKPPDLNTTHNLSKPTLRPP